MDTRETLRAMLGESVDPIQLRVIQVLALLRVMSRYAKDIRAEVEMYHRVDDDKMQQRMDTVMLMVMDTFRGERDEALLGLIMAMCAVTETEMGTAIAPPGKPN
jgi:hypothetical protein